ncbi:MAG: TetR family transcriptional regulator [Polyangiaceae bacterium]|nr:TetR family transcriptional regulator [Polyangiaceae bacterium]
MIESAVSDTRAQILRVALGEFAKRGYHATSIREIAAQVGITKPAVLYHFPGKAEILAALSEPMLGALDAAVAAAELADGEEAARWAILEGTLEVWLAHRYLLRMNLHDLALATDTVVFQRFRDAMMRANQIVAGRRPSLADRVRAAQALAMLSDPVVLLADAPTDALRTHILVGVRVLFAVTEPDERRALKAKRAEKPAAGRRRGRPSAVSGPMRDEARRLLEAGKTADEIAEELGVSRATVYRHLHRDD